MMEPVPQTMTQDGKTVGARTPPHFWSLFCCPSCAISGYETGDPTAGCMKGKALIALILDLLTCICGGVYAVMAWKPDPSLIQGDGTQRTVQDKFCAACCAGGIETVAFWESGDMCCTPDGACTWCSGDALIATIMHFGPGVVGLPPLDCCFTMCCWKPNNMNFKRSTLNHGGGQSVVGAPVQIANAYVTLQQAMVTGNQQPAQVVGAPVYNNSKP
eukprot:CAMPEP_0204577184 /NCGR_PEP_ID=MMETSP0661-20131031/42197_1 /ASSEMBLY_ACC=CAM_ASM_000606 /TAXON_ID=109239 /ORGANISM="Alexandrium margalefi, Strain AMGDE01CS-322" /LENGTH=215 /DNA_ID=CAMNT_0051585987 /DNA_START=73 /DNA_END=720 /DNA_ORIENTATION=+